MPRSISTPRLGWPVALLGAALVCVVLATIGAVRSARSNQRIADAALSGYARFAAWSYQQHLAETIRAVSTEVLGAVNHGSSLHTSLQIPDARELGHYLPYDPRCGCHRPRMAPSPTAFFGFELGRDTIAVAGNQAPPGQEGWLADPIAVPPEGPASADPARRHDPELTVGERAWLVDTLTRVARQGRSPWGYRWLVGQAPAGTVVLAVSLMPTSRGDTIVYAAQFARASFDSMLGAVLDDEGLLPDAFVDRGNRDILALEVVDAAGARLFGAGVPDAWRRDALTRTPEGYGGLGIRVEIRPDRADRLVIGGLPRSRLPLLLALLALAAALAVAAVVQFRREFRFATSRARFVANVSHELRTPLAQIRLAVDTVRLGRERDPERQTAALSLVDREVTRLQHLVDGVLRFARGERADVGEPRAGIDVVAEVEAVVAEFAPLVAPRGVAIAVSPAGRPVVSQRAGALRQVLLNLLDNAAKYGPEGQTIRVIVAARPGGGARITVLDEGPGVPPEERERIWLPFERGTNAAVRAIGGSGIGLTIVREIVVQHGGSAELLGAPEGGGFRIDWPGPVR
ncbi:MAG: sensor histidine kinase [Gemmatimonadales bacterium]